MTRLAAILGLLAALFVAGCGGGGDGGEANTIPEVDAFPDVLEIARAELGEDSSLVGVTVTNGEISFLNVQFGRSTSYTYDASGVFVRSKRSTKGVSPARTFPISDVSPEAPATILAAIGERDGAAVKSFTATLARDRSGKLGWRVRATVDGSAKEYAAASDGSLAG